MTPVLFLDFDGVLNKTSDSYSGRYPTFNEALVAHLNTIVEQTNCDIVISSTWRLHLGIRQLKRRLELFGFKYPQKVIGITPDCSIKEKGPLWIPSSRGEEIATWRQENKHEGPFVAIDDTDDMEGIPSANFVLVNSYYGLTETDAQETIKVLTCDQ